MIKFFRKIRQKLLSENKLTKYLIYGIGEIALIVVGIVIALQLQNWNEKQKLEANFHVTLEKLYNTIKIDADGFRDHSNTFQYHIELIDFILNHPDSIESKDLPYILHNLTMNIEPHNSESSYYSQKLKNNPGDYEQTEISKEII
jgi:hypothetical protein